MNYQRTLVLKLKEKDISVESQKLSIVIVLFKCGNEWGVIVII